MLFHAYIIPFATCFIYTSYHFYAFYGTNLLTRCHSASSLFSAVFGFRKLLLEIFSELHETKGQVPIFQHVHGVRRRDEDSPRGGQTIGWRGRGAHRAAWWFGPLGGPPTSALRLFIPRDVKTLKHRAFHPEHIRCRRHRQP